MRLSCQAKTVQISSASRWDYSWRWNQTILDVTNNKQRNHVNHWLIDDQVIPWHLHHSQVVISLFWLKHYLWDWRCRNPTTWNTLIPCRYLKDLLSLSLFLRLYLWHYYLFCHLVTVATSVPLLQPDESQTERSVISVTDIRGLRTLTLKANWSVSVRHPLTIDTNKQMYKKISVLVQEGNLIYRLRLFTNWAQQN